MGKTMWRGAVALLVLATVFPGAPAVVAAGPAGTPPAASSPAAGETLPPLEYRPASGDSIVVFGAHPDDETLGAGGFIHAAVAAGARVTIVIFTNGDGYLEGVDVGFHTLFSTPARFIRYGEERQQEALRATARLGVPAGHVVFLGYPDRGVAVLWGSRWDCRRPYTSPYTRRDRSPYPLGFRPAVLYCGANALADVEAVLVREHPTIVVVHHAADTHRDHWAAGAFVTSALEALALQGDAWARDVRVFRYLVHYGAWPSPRTYAPDLPLRPPADLWSGGAGWTRFSLDQRSEDAERRAVLEYRSQVALLRSYMLSFVRRNDLFSGSGAVTASPVGENGLPLGAPWDRLPAQIGVVDPGSAPRAAEGRAMLESVAVGRSPSRLFVAVRLRQPAIREAEYRLDLRLFYPEGRMARLMLRVRAPGRLSAVRSRADDLALPPGADAAAAGRRVEVSLPLAALDNPASVYLEAAALGPLGMLVDRTPWTLVRLEPPAAGARRP